MQILRYDAKGTGIETVKARGVVHICGAWYGRLRVRKNYYGIEKEIRGFIYSPKIDRLLETSIPRTYPEPGASDDAYFEAARKELERRGAADITGDVFIEHIHKAAAEGRWTGLLEVEIIRLAEGEAAAQVIAANRARIRAEQEAADELKKKSKAEQERIRAEQEAEAHRLRIEKAEKDLKAGEYISGDDFLLLAQAYNVVLPIKFIGWARKYLIEIKRHFLFLSKHYNVPYYYVKGHNSTTIDTNARKVFDAMGIAAEPDGETYESYKAKQNESI